MTFPLHTRSRLVQMSLHKWGNNCSIWELPRYGWEVGTVTWDVEVKSSKSRRTTRNHFTTLVLLSFKCAWRTNSKNACFFVNHLRLGLKRKKKDFRKCWSTMWHLLLFWSVSNLHPDLLAERGASKVLGILNHCGEPGKTLDLLVPEVFPDRKLSGSGRI